jgi:hypothetical protein
MKLFRIAVLALIPISTSSLSQAQQPREWVPEAVAVLRQGASTRTEFTLDHSLLVLASKLDPGNGDFRRAIAGVNGISVHSFHFPVAGMYDADALAAVKREYKDAGWTQLVNKHVKDEGSGATELWIRVENKAISDIAVLVAKSSDVNLVVVSGSLSPLDLFHLGGHFGIPKIAGGVPMSNSESSQ